MPKTLKGPRVIRPPLRKLDRFERSIVKDEVAMVQRLEQLREEVLELLGRTDVPDVRGAAALLFDDAHLDMCTTANLPRRAAAA